MRSLLSIIRDILNDVTIIPELPGDDLTSVSCDEYQPVSFKINQVTLVRILRLQTLFVKERDKSETPPQVKDDTTFNCIMMERLIVEIIREAHPAEIERLGVRYFIDSHLRLHVTEGAMVLTKEGQ